MPTSSASVEATTDHVVPIVEEQAHVAKRTVETDRVRVRTVVDTHDELVSDVLQVEALTVERRAVNRAVDAAPPPREDGDETIISVVEERLLVTKQLFVIEELVVRRTASHVPVAVPIALRSTRAVVERDPLSTSPQEDH